MRLSNFCVLYIQLNITQTNPEMQTNCSQQRTRSTAHQLPAIQSLCLSVCLSVCLSACLSLSICLPVRLPAFLSACLPCLSVCLPFHLSVCVQGTWTCYLDFDIHTSDLTTKTVISSAQLLAILQHISLLVNSLSFPSFRHIETVNIVNLTLWWRTGSENCFFLWLLV